MSRIASRAARLAAPLPMASVLPATATALAAGPVMASPDFAETAPPRPAAPASDSAAANAPATVQAVAPVQGAAPAAARSTATAAATPKDNAAAAVAPVIAGRTATVAHVARPAAVPHSPATAGGIGSAVFALAMVIGLILALAWLARRLPGFRGAAAGAPALRMVASLALGPRERVVVVAVGDTQLLLGVGPGGTRTLHTLTEPLPVAAPNAAPAFAQLLAQQFGKKA